MEPRASRLLPSLSRRQLQRVVLEADTPGGRLYNLIIFGTILLSVVGLLLEPQPLSFSRELQRGGAVVWIDGFCLIVFLIDYLLHVALSPQPWRYIRSFYGVIDLIAVLFFMVPQISSGVVLWMFKFGRILRVFKLLRFVDEADRLLISLRASARRIAVFILFVVILQVFLGYLMVLVESGHPNSQFQSVGQGVYWAVVTMTTVGYGDVVPQTVLGRLLAAAVMLLGFGIIAIPTGIVSYEAIRQGQNDQRQCSHCGFQGHRPGAEFCDRCGTLLPTSLQ